MSRVGLLYNLRASQPQPIHVVRAVAQVRRKPPLIGQTLAHYRVTAAIGSGGMGEVYRATDTKLGREVAIKVLPAETAQDAGRLARFRREAQLLAALNHPNVAAIHGLDEASGRMLLVLELVEGEDLAQRLKRGPIPLDEALEIAKQVAAALEEAHEKGVVHRDLKPANVKVTPDGKVKVLDFGLAKAFAGDAASGSSPDLSQSPTLAHTGTEAGLIVGTASYMSPEQARGKAVDKRADIWAFGVVLWEMLTGDWLFPGETVSDVLAGVLKTEIDFGRLPGSTPPAIRLLLRRCLERNPKQRLHDIADARILLEEAVPGAGGHALAPAVAHRPPRLLLAALAALALATAGMGWALLRAGSPALATPRSLSVVLPDNLRLVKDTHGTVAISRDGAQVVVVAEDDDGQRLYLRDLGSPNFRALPGTDSAEAPSFSPDGRWLAFSQEGLKKLSLDGGAPVLLAPRMNGAGAWSPEGQIYFTSDYDKGLSRVAAAGGAAQELTRPDPAQGELSHIFPELLPGGRALVFTSFRMPFAGSRIEALSLASGERHVVVEHAIEARYLGSGHLAFVRDEALMVAPFDPETLRVTGPALPARHEVAVSYADGHAEYALSENGILALVPRSVMPARREVVRLDRAGRAETVLAAEKAWGGPALSPDGRQLLLTRNEGGLDVLLYDLERRTTTRLAASPRTEFSGVWAPSGTRVFHAVDLPPFQIFEVETSAATEPRRMLEGSQDQIPRAVSPDGRWLLYSQGTGINLPLLGILPLGRPQEARLFRAEGAESSGTFSPDGRYVAYQSNESGRAEIYVRPVSEAARGAPVSRAGGWQPCWARNGELFFWQRDQLVAVSVRTSPALAIAEPRPLFRAARDARSNWLERDYDVSADGQSIYLARTPDLLRPRELRVVVDWASEVASLFARGAGN